VYGRDATQQFPVVDDDDDDDDDENNNSNQRRRRRQRSGNTPQVGKKIDLPIALDTTRKALGLSNIQYPISNIQYPIYGRMGKACMHAKGGVENIILYI